MTLGNIPRGQARETEQKEGLEKSEGDGKLLCFLCVSNTSPLLIIIWKFESEFTVWKENASASDQSSLTNQTSQPFQSA